MKRETLIKIFEAVLYFSAIFFIVAIVMWGINNTEIRDYQFEALKENISVYREYPEISAALNEALEDRKIVRHEYQNILNKIKEQKHINMLRELRKTDESF